MLYANTLTTSSVTRLGGGDLDRLLDDDLDPHPYYVQVADAVAVSIEDELGPWLRTPAREPGGDLRLHAIATAATDAARTAPEAVAARRARRTPHPVAAVDLRHLSRDAAHRQAAEAEIDSYFADRDPLAA
ncbi:hypothetical protein OIE68_00370 [Nocardia vinacea]|uniref:hypothetical protein n=1 Tax=Nocardia vinacea TaxID=96468 RepID=UPI002E0F44DE|nr:hypothetical protein OIE68_00370 [Nocardia vinacea]